MYLPIDNELFDKRKELGIILAMGLNHRCAGQKGILIPSFVPEAAPDLVVGNAKVDAQEQRNMAHSHAFTVETFGFQRTLKISCTVL